MSCRSGTAWAASLGSSGSRPQHIEESLHRAAAVPGNTPIQCPLIGSAIPVKNRPQDRVRLQNLARLRAFRYRRQASLAKARAKKKPQKRKGGNKTEDTPFVFETWPVLLPHMLFESVINAGLLENLTLDIYGNVFLLELHV